MNEKKKQIQIGNNSSAKISNERENDQSYGTT